MAQKHFERINEYAQHFSREAVAFTQEMIKKPSLSGQEKEMATLYLEELKKLGYDEAFQDGWGNVVGIMKGNKPGPTIMFNGHLDQLDVGNLQEWEEYQPFEAPVRMVDVFDQEDDMVVHKEAVLGRGASDCKGGLAAQVYAGALIKKIREEGALIPGNYMVTAVVMEELGEQVGMIKLIDETFQKAGISFDGAVSCEATGLKMNLGHMGRVEIMVTVFGKTAHGSAPWNGINAVNKAVKLIEAVDKINTKTTSTSPLSGSTVALTNIKSFPEGTGVVPDRCEITFDRRFNDTENASLCLEQIQKIIDHLKKEDAEFHAEVEIARVTRKSFTGQSTQMESIKEAWRIDPHHEYVESMARGLEKIGQEAKYGYWGFGTDMAYIYKKLGKPTIGYSPGQEVYIGRYIDRVRVDFIEKAIAGNASMFFEIISSGKKASWGISQK